MLIRYARISTDDQDEALQIDALVEAGCEQPHIYVDRGSGSIRERTSAGLAAARARALNGGRPRKRTERQIAIARRLYTERQHTVDEIVRIVGVSRRTIYRSLDQTAV